MNKIILSAFALTSLLIAPQTMAQDEGEGMDHDRGLKKFQTLDSNEDGLISRSEFKAKRDADFKSMDVDGDGVMAPKEFSKHVKVKANENREKIVKVGKVRGLNKCQVKGHIKKQAKMQFGHLDVNRDKEITREEFDVAGDRAFSNMDANGDGSLTFVETQFGFRELMKRGRQAMKVRKGEGRKMHRKVRRDHPAR